MKKLFVFAFMALAFCIGSNAQTVISNNYGSPISGADGQSINDDDDVEGLSYAGLTYLEGDVFALNFRGQNWNAVGYELNMFAYKGFDAFEANVNINYSLGLWKESNKALLLTLAAGPTLMSYKDTEYNQKTGKTKEKDKICSNLFVNPYFAFKVDRFVISAGYAFRFNKWKFKDRGEGFHAGLGYCF